MPTSLLFRNRRKGEVGVVDGDLDIITFDAMLSEEHSSEYAITEHPIEAGASISDHKRRKPRRLTLTGVVTNTPLLLLNFNPPEEERDVSAWELLQKMQELDSLIGVFTTLEQHENLQIESISAPRDAARGNSLEVTIVFREINVVESAVVEARQGQDKSPRPPKKKLDKQNTVTKEPSQSLAAKGADALGSLF